MGTGPGAGRSGSGMIGAGFGMGWSGSGITGAGPGAGFGTVVAPPVRVTVSVMPVWVECSVVTASDFPIMR